MRKLDSLVKINGSTQYFQQVELTDDELTVLYCYGHARPSWLKTVCINENIDDIIAKYKKVRPTAKNGFFKIVNQWSDKKDYVKDRLVSFSNGDLDLIDLSVEFGVFYKDVKKFFKYILTDVDVDDLYKKHKKYSQEKSTQFLYGVSHSSLDPEVKAKRCATLFKNYGVLNPMHSQEISNRLRQTMLDRYSVTTNLLVQDRSKNWAKLLFNTLVADDEWRNVIKKLCLDYDSDFDYTFFIGVLPIHVRDFKLSVQLSDNISILFYEYFKINNKLIEYPTNCLFSLNIECARPWLYKYIDRNLLKLSDGYNFKMSDYELVIKDFLDSLNVKYKHCSRILDGYEIDFYLEDKKIGIEVNPLFTHNSNLYNMAKTLRPLSKDYHYKKYKLAQSKNIKLLQLYEWDFHPRRIDMTKQRLKQIIIGYDEKIYARKTTICLSSDKKFSRNFLRLHHTQGAGKADLYFNMFDENNRLIGVMSILKNEIKRMSFLPNLLIVGGVSKFVDFYFKIRPNENTLYTYSDNDIGSGDGYKKSGATFIRETGPSLWFVSWSDPLDKYSWSIATKWGADSGVISKNRGSLPKLTKQDDIDKYIELEMKHRFDDNKGYSRLYTSGSKLWRFDRRSTTISLRESKTTS